MQKSTDISVQKWYSLNSLSQSDFFSIWKVFNFHPKCTNKKVHCYCKDYSLHVSIYTEREIAKFIFYDYIDTFDFFMKFWPLMFVPFSFWTDLSYTRKCLTCVSWPVGVMERSAGSCPKLIAWALSLPLPWLSCPWALATISLAP